MKTKDTVLNETVESRQIILKWAIFWKQKCFTINFKSVLSFILWIKMFWCRNLTHRFPHLSLEAAVTGVAEPCPLRPAEWQQRSYLSQCSGTCKTDPASGAWWPTITVWPEATCFAALPCRSSISRTSFLSQGAWRSLLGARTENASCAKGLARSLAGAQLSMRLLARLQQQGS